MSKHLGASPVPGLTIEWPSPFPGRIRRVISRSGAHRRYVVACYRHGDLEAHADATEEASAFALLDACAGVEFQEQPARLKFDWLDGQHEHVPDILVATGARSEFWECKRSSEADGFWIRKRSERMRELLLPLGVGYRVVTGDVLHRGSFLANAQILRRFAKHVVAVSASSEATARTCAAGEIVLSRLASFLSGEEPIADVLALVYAGTLCADLRAPLTAHTPIRLPSTEEERPWVWQLFDAASA
ncbi:MAG TPA: hypothetical protein VFQ88_10730 [Nevskiaceae bacterium]|nr:hypothetical protein [Nevskiaceae bacterium]